MSGTYRFSDEESERVTAHRRQLHHFGDQRTEVAYIAEDELFTGSFEESFANTWINAQYGGISLNPTIFVCDEGKWLECSAKSEHLYTNAADYMHYALRLVTKGGMILGVVEVSLDGRA